MLKRIWMATIVALLCAPGAMAQVIYEEDFSGSDGGYTVTDDNAPESPWTYDSVAEAWFTDGTSEKGEPSHTRLTSPLIDITETGAVDLSFSHFYSIEGGAWDGGAVFTSVNGGTFEQVLSDAFTENGYTAFDLIGNHDLNGLDGFGDDSVGYPAPITSTASLGTMTAGDTLAIQFLMANDEYSKGASLPNWQIESVSLTAVPEPTSLALLAVCGLLALRVRR
ncbi:PEP-CTERM sorting domain-containing protein [Aeoliella mucimassa]|uniref:Ice-binding protein C-terminal domain-containing protein n=1 Tax=Aeoliella mucimassa TaxID=2527972 RepID=A0A518AT56_9BACT|nr:PEP-CTERM sorting domain-containing protein [Aeoliella mucimassa]QDU57886.1 hypothetical protein Pan181_41090 [Aeoliella mucimassa]